MHLAPPPGPWGVAPPNMRTLRLSGNFTMLKYLLHRTPAELERRLGFHAGRLDTGGWVIVLAPGERMSATDFRLDASTRWSGGRFAPTTAQDTSRRIEDLLGARLGDAATPEQREQEIARLRALVADFFAEHWLNAPAKVLPAATHKPGMRYPHAQALAPGVRSGVPQFTVTHPAGKRAVIAMPIRAARSP